MEHLELFTDGGATKIRKKYFGSAAYVIKFKGKYFITTDPVKEGTNNYYELKAMRDGLRAITSNWRSLADTEVWIISDSQYAISCVTKWFNGWKCRRGKYYNSQGNEIANIELILEIRKLLEKIPHSRFIKIRSHIGASIDSTYQEFKMKNRLDVTLAEYLMLVHFNDLCDKAIANAMNYLRRDLARSIGVDFV